MRMLLRRGIALDRETAREIIDRVMEVLPKSEASSQPRRTRRPRPRRHGGGGEEPMF